MAKELKNYDVRVDVEHSFGLVVKATSIEHAEELAKETFENDDAYLNFNGYGDVTVKETDEEPC